jgi:XTP/dITP diphosphohydrolase
VADGATGAPLLEFLEVMRRLRAECGWKREQTHRSLARYLLEETHETLEAIDTGDAAHLREELGDLLLQVYFHAVIAEESGEFTIDDVAADIVAKMHRRNPHVFAPAADSPVEAADINDAWQQIKATEKQRTSLTDGLPPGLPALLYADKVLDRLERASGGSATNAGVEKGEGSPPSGVEPVETTHDLGDRLLTIVAEARATGTDPEQALRDAVRRLLAGAADG